MFSFRNFGKLSEKFSSKNFRNYTPYLMIAILLAAVIIPVWADAPTQVSTFAELKAALAKGGNIKVMADIVDEEASCLAITKDVTLDLNGHKLSKTNITGSEVGDQTRYFFNVYDGTFTINNSANTVGEINAAAASKTAKPRAVAANAREENKHPKVIVNKGVKLSATNPTITGFFNKDNYKNAKGHVLGVYTPNGYASDARKEPSSRTSSAEAIINEGATLNGIGQGVYVEGYGAKVTVNGGYINGTRQAIYNGGGAEVVVNDGVLSVAFNNAISNCKATATINGGTWLGMGNAAISNFDDDTYIDPKTGEPVHEYPDCSAKAVLTVNGGTFSGNVYNEQDRGNTLKIYNGKFTDGYRAEMFLAEGATGTWEDNWYVVRSYEQVDTAQEFLNAIAAGGNYKLGTDIELTSQVEISKDLTLDMNGHKLSRTNIAGGTKGSDRYFLIVRNGIFTINNNSGTQGQIYAAAANAQAAPRAVAAFPNADGCHAKIVVNGNVLIKGYNANGYGSVTTGINGIGVYTNYLSDEYASSSARKKSAEAVVNAGEIYGTKYGLSLEGYGVKVTVNNGQVSGGARGIVVSAGAEAVVNGGSVSGEKHGIEPEKATAIINGGTVTGTSNAIHLYSDSENTAYPEITHVTEARVNNGTISGGLYPDEGTILANGGKFTADPSAYKAEGATVTQEGNYYVVKLGDGCIGTLGQLRNALQNGGEYTLGADIEIPLNDEQLYVYENFTLNMNGYKIHKTTNLVTSHDCAWIIFIDGGTTTINGPGEIVCEAIDNPQARPRAILVLAKSGYFPKLVLNGTNGELKVADKGGAEYNINDQSAGGSSAIYLNTKNTEGSILGTAKCEINGNVTVSSGRHALMVESPGGYATINGGTFNAVRNAISNNWGGVVTVNGGTFNGGNSAIYNCKSTTTVNGGTFTGTKSAIYNDDESQEPTPFYPSSVIVPTINIADGTFTGNIVNLTAKLPSKITISGGKYTADPKEYITEGKIITHKDGYYTVSDAPEESNYRTVADKTGEIPGGTITAKIEVLFKELQGEAIKGIEAIINYATDVLELISAIPGEIAGEQEPVTTTAGKISFRYYDQTGIQLSENKYYNFGTMTFKIKPGVTIGKISELLITDELYLTGAGYTEHTPSITNTEIEIYQPVTAVNITTATGEDTMLVQSTLQLNADIQPATAHTKDLQWTSSDETKATVDTNGLVTAKEISSKSANVTITATALDGSGVTGTKTLTITHPPVTSMNFAKSSYQLTNDTASLDLYKELSVAPQGAYKPMATEIQWQSSNSNFNITNSGVVTINTPQEEKQTTTITAKYTNEKSEQITAACTVNTKPKKITMNLATKLEARQSGGGENPNTEQMEVWLYDSANRPLWNGTGTTDTQGKLSLKIDSNIITEGQTVKLWIKGARYLAKLQTETITLQEEGTVWNITMQQTLKAGDGNNDNKIGLQDFIIFDEASGTMEGETGYDARADYNGDSKIRLTDFALLGRNYGQKGDNKPEAAVTMLLTAATKRGSLETAMALLSPQTAKIAEDALATANTQNEEQQEEIILAAVQNATKAELKAEETVTDSKTEQTTDKASENGSESSSSGGCNAGYGALALMFAIPMLWIKKK